jgi:ABC-type transport system involved in multi-copper enzyme maturation permease subunit
VFAVALTALVASIVRTVPATVLVTIGLLILLGIFSIVPRIADWLPSALPGSLDDLIRDGAFEYWPSIVVTIVTIVLSLVLATSFFRRREV